MCIGMGGAKANLEKTPAIRYRRTCRNAVEPKNNEDERRLPAVNNPAPPTGDRTGKDGNRQKFPVKSTHE